MNGDNVSTHFAEEDKSATRYLFIGAGDLAREITRIAQENATIHNRKIEIAYFTEIPPDPHLWKNKHIYFSHEEVLQYCPPDDWETICCVGDPKLRARFFDEFSKLNYKFGKIISKQTTLESDNIMEGAVIFPGVRIAIGCRIELNVVINYNAVIGHDTVIGNHSVVSPGVNLGGRIIGGEKVLYGIGASILQRITIGNNAVIAAGSSVWFHVPDDITMVGVPAVKRKIPGRKK